MKNKSAQLLRRHSLRITPVTGSRAPQVPRRQSPSSISHSTSLSATPITPSPPARFVRYFIPAPVLDPRDMSILFQGDDGPEAERVLRLADAEAESLFDVALAAHKRGRDTDSDEEEEEEGAARGAHRRGVNTTIAHPDVAAALSDDGASAQPAEERLAALIDDDYYYWQFAYNDEPADDFLPVGRADDEDDCTVYGEWGVMPPDRQEDEVPLGEKKEEQFASDMRHPAEDDDYLVYSQCYGTALYQGMLDEKGEHFASGYEDFLPMDLTEDGSDDMAYRQDFDYKLPRPALDDRRCLEVAEDAADQIDMTRYQAYPELTQDGSIDLFDQLWYY